MEVLEEPSVIAKPFVRSNMPRIRGRNKFDKESRLANMLAAFGRGLMEATVLIGEEQGMQAVIIGGGPSINDQVETIRRLHKQNARIVCIERMYDWCWNHGIRPDYVVTMDASDDVTQAFDNLHPGSVHLVASQCQPAVFDRLASMRPYLFTTPQDGIDFEQFFTNYPSITMVNGAGSVVLCALSLSMLLGMRTLHMFGFDCHITNGRYARGIVGTGEPTQLCYATVGSRRYCTTIPFLCFVQQFFELRHWAKALNECDDIKIYGDSLVTAMSKEPIGGDR